MFAQTPVVGTPAPDDPPPLEDVAPELELVIVPEELPDELPPPELPPGEASSASAGVEPVEHALLNQELAAKNEMNTAVSAILKFKCRMFFPAPVLRRPATKPPAGQCANSTMDESLFARKAMAFKRPKSK
jgi:hypothetical protein